MEYISATHILDTIKDKVNVTEDMMKAQHILDTFDSEVNKDCFLDVEELSGYINLVKKLSPKEIKYEKFTRYNCKYNF